MQILKINQLTNEEKGMKQAGHITIDHKYVEIHFTAKKIQMNLHQHLQQLVSQDEQVQLQVQQLSYLWETGFLES